MSKEKLLTVAIPNYNGGKHLENAILSCRNIDIDLDKFEILVVDNCSTDNSIEIVNNLKTKFNNIRLIKNIKNIGRVENWNKCIELSNGKYLIFLFSSDQIYDSNIVNESIKLLDINHQISLMKLNVKFDYIEQVYEKHEKEKVIDLKDFIKLNFIKNKNYASLGILQQHIYRMSVIKEHNIKFDNNIPRTADRVFIFEVIKNGSGKLIEKNDIICKWNLTDNRFHKKVHIDNIENNIELIWGNEIKANRYIMQSMGYQEEDIKKEFYKHYIRMKVIKFKLKITKSEIPKELLILDEYLRYIEIDNGNIDKFMLAVKEIKNILLEKLKVKIKVER